MKLLKTLLAALAVAALTSSASAIVFEQLINKPNSGALKTFSSSRTSAYNNTWKTIANADHGLLKTFLDNNSAYYISKVVVTFGFAEYATGSNNTQKNRDAKDHNSSYEEYAYVTVQSKYVDLGGQKNSNGATEVDGTHPTSNFDYHSGNLHKDDFGKVTDGKVEFRVKSDFGSFYLKTAKIEVHVNTVSVPDSGATAGLLAIAIAGLVALRRRFAK